MTCPNRRPKPCRGLTPEVLFPDEVNAPLASCKGECCLAVRTPAIIAVPCRSGLGIADAWKVHSAAQQAATWKRTGAHGAF